MAIYHEEGHSAALAYLAGNRGDGTKGLTGSFGPGGRYAAWGARTRQSLDRYFRFDREERRDYAQLPLKAEVALGRHWVGAVIDVVMFDDAGYVGRVLNWDKTGVDLDVAEIVAVPAAMLIEQELGRDTCVHIAVWDLENSRQFEIDGPSALAWVAHASTLMDQVEDGVQ